MITPERTRLIQRLTELHVTLYCNPLRVDLDLSDEYLADWVEELIELATADRRTIKEIQASLIRGGN